MILTLHPNIQRIVQTCMCAYNRQKSTQIQMFNNNKNVYLVYIRICTYGIKRVNVFYSEKKTSSCCRGLSNKLVKIYLSIKAPQV